MSVSPSEDSVNKMTSKVVAKYAILGASDLSHGQKNLKANIGVLLPSTPFGVSLPEPWEIVETYLEIICQEDAFILRMLYDQRHLPCRSKS